MPMPLFMLFWIGVWIAFFLAVVQTILERFGVPVRPYVTYGVGAVLSSALIVYVEGSVAGAFPISELCTFIIGFIATIALMKILDN